MEVYLISPSSLRKDCISGFLELFKKFDECNIEYYVFASRDDNITDRKIVIPKRFLPLDIWTRDSFPIYSSKTNTYIQFIYAPHYVRENCVDIRHSRQLTYWFFIEKSKLKEKKDINYEFYSIKADGGMFVVAGNNLFISKLVLKNNLNKDLSFLKRHFDNIYLIDSPDITLGHIDHLIFPVNDELVLYSDLIYEQVPLKKIKVNFIKEKVELNEEKVEIINHPHLNFLKVDNYVFIGVVEKYKSWFEGVAEILEKLDLKPILVYNLDRIHYWGGSIHCITWENASN